MRTSVDVLKSVGLHVGDDADVRKIVSPNPEFKIARGMSQLGMEASRAGLRKSPRERLDESLGLTADPIRKALDIDGDQGYMTPDSFTVPVDTHAESFSGPLPGEVREFMNSATVVDFDNARQGDDHAEREKGNQALTVHNKSESLVQEDDLIKAFGAFDAEDEEGEEKKGKSGFKKEPKKEGAAAEKQKLEQAEKRKAAHTPEAKAKATKSVFDEALDLVKGKVLIKGDLEWMQHPGDSTMMYAKDGVKTIFSPSGKDRFTTVDGNHVSYTHGVGDEENSLTRTFNTSKEAMEAGWNVAVASGKQNPGREKDADHVNHPDTYEHEGKRSKAVEGHDSPTFGGPKPSEKHEGGINFEGHDKPVTGEKDPYSLDKDHVNLTDTFGTHEKSLGDLLDDLVKGA